MAAIALYVFVRLILPLPLPLPVKLLLGAGCFLLAERLHLVRLFMGPAGIWELNRTTLLLTAFGHLLVLLLFVLTLGRDLALLLTHIVRGPGGFARPGFSALVSGPIGAAGVFCAAVLITIWGMWAALKVPDTQEVRVAVRRLPPELDGLRVVQLSDLHGSAAFRKEWLQEIVARSNQAHPDLVVITGDLTDGRPERLAPDLAPLEELRARYGVFVIPGNHDYFSGFRDWMRFFRNLGLHVLLNEHEVIDVRGTPLVLAGVTDPVAVRVGEAGPDPARALAGAPSGAFRLLLAHRPTGATINHLAGADLQLSGHTHGGQVLPLAPITALFNEGFASGLYTVNGMPLYVHPGSGLWAGAPFRLGVPSQIALLVLSRASDPSEDQGS